MIPLGNRLRAAASLVRGGGVLADIGTDHAYLPVFLVQNGIASRVIASDIGEGPLNNAKKTVEAWGLSDSIELRLSDGLSNYTPNEVDEIVICGMGGNLIEEILTAAPWVGSPGMHLVVQPMTHAEDARRYLCENGFQIQKELAVEDAGRIYLHMSALWTGRQNDRNEGFYYFGLLPHQPGPAQTIVKKQLNRIKTRLRSLSAVERNPEEQELLKRVLNYYETEINT